MRYIYSLSFENKVIYIGQTNNPERRKREHLQALRSQKHDAVLLDAYNTGEKPQWAVLEELSSDDMSVAGQYEAKWISHYRSMGYNCVNENLGFYHTNEYKAKISETMKKVLSDETMREKWSLAATNRFKAMTDEEKDDYNKIRQLAASKRKGTKLSAELKKKISEGTKNGMEKFKRDAKWEEWCRNREAKRYAALQKAKQQPDYEEKKAARVAKILATKRAKGLIA